MLPVPATSASRSHPPPPPSPPPRPPAPAYLHAVEPGFQPELLNHFLHSGDAGGTRHGALKSGQIRPCVDLSVRGSAGPDGGAARRGAGLGTLSLKFPVLCPAAPPAARMRAPPPRSVPAPHPGGERRRREGEKGVRRGGADCGLSSCGTRARPDASFLLPLPRGRLWKGKKEKKKFVISRQDPRGP